MNRNSIHEYLGAEPPTGVGHGLAGSCSAHVGLVAHVLTQWFITISLANFNNFSCPKKARAARRTMAGGAGGAGKSKGKRTAQQPRITSHAFPRIKQPSTIIGGANKSRCKPTVPQLASRSSQVVQNRR